MLKAYLAHSSLDKGYVRIVANRFGRGTTIYDEMAFPPGFDFRDTIKSSLDKSSTFIFFASKASLESTWVKYEISEADWLLATKEMAGSLTILIDDETQKDDLPKWMQRNLVVRVSYPQLAVHTIRNFLVQLSITGIKPIFVGREADLERISKKLIPELERHFPRVIVVAGLSGIGRRTFAKRALRDYLTVDTGPIFILEDTDTIDVLYVQILNETTDLSKRKYLASLLEKFRSFDYEEKGQEIARLLTLINRNNQVPIIVDNGPRGILLDEFTGWYREEWLYLLKALKSFAETYLLLIQPRVPNIREVGRDRGDISELAIDRLGPLSTEAVEMLLRESIHKSGLSMSSAQIKELAPYIDGYPPAAQFSLGYVQMYGADMLLAEKAGLTDFLAHQFDAILTKLVIDEKEKYILRLLAAQTSLM